jgi:hypothetical protein
MDVTAGTAVMVAGSSEVEAVTIDHSTGGVGQFQG